MYKRQLQGLNAGFLHALHGGGNGLQESSLSSGNILANLQQVAVVSDVIIGKSLAAQELIVLRSPLGPVEAIAGQALTASTAYAAVGGHGANPVADLEVIGDVGALLDDAAGPVSYTHLGSRYERSGRQYR